MLHRTLPLIVALALTSLVNAQAPGYIFFETESPMDRSQLKFIIQAVKDADPAADVFHSDDMTILQIKQSGGLTEQGYREVIVQSGIPLRAGTRTAESLALNATNPNGPPVYVATGDETADQARYQTAVEQWNAAHPDQLLNTTPVHLR